MEAVQRVRVDGHDTRVHEREVAYVSIRRNPNTDSYRIVGFEDSTDPNLQNLYGDFTEGQANAVLVRVGMSPSQARQTLSKVIQCPQVVRFHLELTSEQNRFFRYTLGGSRHLPLQSDRIASHDLAKAFPLHRKAGAME